MVVCQKYSRFSHLSWALIELSVSEQKDHRVPLQILLAPKRATEVCAIKLKATRPHKSAQLVQMTGRRAGPGNGIVPYGNKAIAATLVWGMRKL